jgi:hypothetical protein
MYRIDFSLIYFLYCVLCHNIIYRYSVNFTVMYIQPYYNFLGFVYLLYIQKFFIIFEKVCLELREIQPRH